MLNLPDAWSVHLATLPRTWTDEQLDAHYGVWLQGWIAACEVLYAHYDLETATPKQMRDIGNEELDALIDGHGPVWSRGVRTVRAKERRPRA